jgi:N-acetylglucosaminyldiphosphoundecaprenol N-acetyl-beta-D-mannosaminyltransferase
MNVEKINILNIPFSNLSESEFLENCQKGLVVTPNVDFFFYSHKDKDFYNIINSADFVLCDSQLILFASRFLNKRIKQKLSGSDIFPKFCFHHRNNTNIKVFLMGAMPGVAKKAANKINSQVGRDIVTSFYSPKFGYENDVMESEKMISMFNDSGANVLAFGTGCPKSEKWLNIYKNKLNAEIIFCIGATIDFQAGNIQRAPKWMSHLCLEWLYRLLKEPKRLWRRYLINDPKFFWLILKEKMGIYKNPMS